MGVVVLDSTAAVVWDGCFSFAVDDFTPRHILLSSTYIYTRKFIAFGMIWFLILSTSQPFSHPFYLSTQTAGDDELTLCSQEMTHARAAVILPSSVHGVRPGAACV